LEKFLKEETELPAIAIRETQKVLKTGRKNSKKNSSIETCEDSMN
jgi:hypothetical protein